MRSGKSAWRAILVLLTVVVALFVGSSAYAQTLNYGPDNLLTGGSGGDAALAAGGASPATASKGCGTQSAWSMDAKTLTGVVDSLLSPFKDADKSIADTANNLASQMMPGAYALGSVLGISYFLWASLRYLADGKDNYMGVVVDSLIPIGIGVAVLKNYSQLVSGLQGIFTSMLVGPLSGGLTGQIAQLGRGLLNGIANGYIAEWNAMGCTSLLSTLAVYFNAFLTLLLLFISTILAVIALAELVGVLLTGSVLMGIGITVGPYFVIAGITPWSRNFMDKWLGFLMGAYFYKTLISIILALVNGVITDVVKDLSSYNGTTGLPLGKVLALVGLMWILRHIFQGVPSIVASLIGGHKMNPPSLNRDLGNVISDVYKALEKMERAEREERREAREERAEQRDIERTDMLRTAMAGGGGGQGSSGPTVNTQRGAFTPSGGGSVAPGAGFSSNSGAAQASPSGPSFGGGSGANFGSTRFRPQGGDVQDVNFSDVQGGGGPSAPQGPSDGGPPRLGGPDSGKRGGNFRLP
jgi:hypothetical protein